MPTYEVTEPGSGKKYRVTTPQPVGPDEIMGRVRGLQGQGPESAPQQSEPWIGLGPATKDFVEFDENLKARYFSKETGQEVPGPLGHYPMEKRRPRPPARPQPVYPAGQGGDQVTGPLVDNPWRVTDAYQQKIDRAPDPNKPFSNADWLGGIASSVTAGALHPFGIVNRLRAPKPPTPAPPVHPAFAYQKALTAGDGTTVGQSWKPAEGDFRGLSAEGQIAEEAAGIQKRLQEYSTRRKARGYTDPIQGDKLKRDDLLDRIAESMVRTDTLGRRVKATADAAPVNTPPRTFEAGPGDRVPTADMPPDVGLDLSMGETARKLNPEVARQKGAKPDVTAGTRNATDYFTQPEVPTRQLPGDMPGRRQKVERPARPIGGGSDAPDAVAQAGAAVRDTPPGSGRTFMDAIGHFTSTVLGRMEKFGPEGGEVSRRVQKTLSDASRWYAAHIDPILHTLSGLNPSQRRLFFEAADRGATVADPQVAQALAVYHRTFGQGGTIPAEAARLGVMTREGGRLRPFEELSNYFPHEWAPKVRDAMFRQGDRQYSEAARAMVESGQARNLAEARATLRRVQLADRKVGGLEFSRNLNLPGYLEDPLQAISLRGWKVAQRFAELQNYGKNADEIQNLVRSMEQTGRHAEARRLHGLFELATSPDPVGGSLRDLATKVMGWEAVTKLPLASIANLTQPAWLAVRTDFGTTVKALLSAARHPHEARQAAQELGMLSDISVRQLLQEMAGGRTGRLKELLLTPYMRTEQFVRILGGNAGRLWVQKLQGRLSAGDTGPELQRELSRLLLSPAEIRQALASRSFNPDQMARMAWAVADQVMFMPQAARRSEFMQSALGSMTMQFKGFAINTGRMLHQTIVKEAQQGNMKPLANLLALTPLGVLVGEGVGDVRALITGNSRTTNLGARLVENLMFIGGLGLATDFVRALGSNGAAAITNFLVGPGLSDALQVATQSVQALGGAVQQDAAKIEQNLLGLVRWGARQVPFVGARLSRELSSTPKERRREDWSAADRLGFTQKARELEENETEQGKRTRARQWERTKQGIRGN